MSNKELLNKYILNNALENVIALSSESQSPMQSHHWQFHLRLSKFATEHTYAY